MAFQGSLTELHLPDIVQLMSVSGKTGVFELSDGPLQGQIFLRDGQIVHAQIEDAQGEEAVYALAIWNKGEFRFEPGVATDLRTISKSNTNLLMEAARRLDEWRVLSKKIPSTDLIPEFVVLEGREGQINLNTGEWLILSKIDGQRSIKAIAGASGLTVFDAAKVLYGLVATGLIRLRETPRAPVPPTASAARPTLAATPAAPTVVAASTASPAPPHAPARPAPPTALPKPAPQPAAPSPLTPLTPHAPLAAPAASAPHPSLAAPAPPGAVAAAGRLVPELLARLDRVRDVGVSFLGAVGESVVTKHHQKARAELEQGAGAEAIEEAIQQVVRATSILKGPTTSEALLQQLRGVK